MTKPKLIKPCYLDEPNIGTVVTLPPNGMLLSNISIDKWWADHPDYTLSFAYGVYVSMPRDLEDPDDRIGISHGDFLCVEDGKGKKRFYWFCGSAHAGKHPMPARAILDFDTPYPVRDFHFPDLKWFNPYPNAVMKQSELIEEVRRRMAWYSGGLFTYPDNDKENLEEKKAIT